MDWEAALARAAGDDAALLALTRGAAPVDVKLAAVGALASEEALKRAERELRKQDRRVYRLAKQRHAELIARRGARIQATQLTTAARAMLDERLIAVNRLVELDRAWQALDPALLEGSQAVDFTALFARLTALARERADHALDLERFSATAREAIAGLNSASGQAAAGTIDRAALASSAAQAQAVLDTAPGDDELVARHCEALRNALGSAAELAARLELLDALLHTEASPEPQPSPQPQTESAAAEVADTASTCASPSASASATASETARSSIETKGSSSQATANALQPCRPAAASGLSRSSSQATANALQRWRALAPLADASLAQALDARFSNWQRAQLQAGPKRQLAPPVATVAADDGARLESLARSVERAETALAEGHLADAGAQLSAIDALLGDSSAPTALRTRIDHLHAEAARLRAWQHWGGARARDELVAQAEALAAADADAPDAAVARLTTRQRAELIGEMRARWRELDRHGGASNRALWQRFDAALKAAYAPVAAQADVQRATREQNLQARIELLNTLEGVALPGDDGPESSPGDAPEDAPETASRVASDTSLEAAPEARPPAAVLATALADFHSAWRKLGPLEHTVPRTARESLQARMQTAVARLDGPLSEARRVAQAQREQLIARARALVAGNASTAQNRDGLEKVRALQTEWQQSARSLPLARAVENALWSEFKTAIDAIYDARHADMAARDAACKAQVSARTALIERLEAIATQDSTDDIKRTLSEVDTQWRQAGAAPRTEAEALEARFRTARDAAQALVTSAKQRRWRARCDTLIARLAERDGLHGDDQGSGTEPASHAVQPTTQAALPQEWEHALARQANVAPADARSNDDLLLKLEAALGIDSPPAFHEARRTLKLQAMKAALEARPAGVAAPLAADDLLVEAVARDAFDAAQRERLRRIVEAIRSREPMQID